MAGFWTSSETQGQSVGGGRNGATKVSRTGGRTPGYQVSPDHFQTASRIPAPDWAEKIPCIILPNQEPVFAKPFGNGPVRLGTQGFFRPFLKTFVAPFRPPPTDCPWVSEDGFWTSRFLILHVNDAHNIPKYRYLQSN